MSVSSIEFLALVLLLCGVFFLLPVRSARRGVLAIVNLGVLLWASLIGGAPPSPWSFMTLVMFLFSGYGVARLLAKRPSGVVLTAYLALLALIFVYIKKYVVLGALLPPVLFEHPVSIVGLSYMLFRQIHFVVDSAQGQIAAPQLWTYLNYQINFTTLLAGPIQRYQDFARDWDRAEPLGLTAPDRVGLFQRIFWGVIKIVVLATLCTSIYDSAYVALKWALSGSADVSKIYVLRQFLAMLYAYPAFVYFNFSGYCDVVIGTAALLGMRLPENFDRPYMSRNMIDFWTRQHMTLSFWIRDYLFTPLYKAIVERSMSLAQPAVYVCYFIAFLLAGIWHGSTMNFVVFGLMHGAGVSSVKIWETIIVKRVGRQGLKRYLQIRWVRVAAIFITLNFVSVAFVFFTPDLQQKLNVLGGVFKFVFFGIVKHA